MIKENSKTFVELCDEAHENAKNDRDRMKTYLEKITKSAEKDPQLGVLIGDVLVKVADCMTKSNSQIIQIAQLKLKQDAVMSSNNSDEFSDDEIDTVYEEIGKTLEDKAKDDKN